MTTLQLQNITKKYENGYEAVRGVDIDVRPGEFMVLVGPSGCGKSTILRMIAGLEQASSGDILFDNQRMNDVEPRKRDVGMVFQNYALYPHLTVAENIAFPLQTRKNEKQSKENIAARVREVANMLSIEHLLERLPKQLSGGQRQRVAVGRAIARTPKVFLFDEPLSNLDAALRVEMRSELTTLQRKVGTTAVYVTHDHAEAMTMGDRIVVLNNGKVEQIGTPEELYSNPVNEFVAKFLGTPSINIFRGKVWQGEGGLHFVEDAPDSSNPLRIHLPDFVFTTTLPQSGSAVTLALRPEHIVPATETKEQFHAHTETVEFMGHETLLYFRTGNSLKIARASNQKQYGRGERVGYTMNTLHALIFDDAGRRM